MKISRMDISFWRRKSKTAFKALIYCRITVQGERIDIGSTGITIYHDHWQDGRVSPFDREAFFKNEQLDIMRDQLRAIYNDLFRKREKITAAKIRRIYEGSTANVTLLSAFELYLKDSASDPERELDAETVAVYDRVRKKLVDFLLSVRATDLLIEEFDLEWIKRYQRYMKLLELPGGKGHATSYILKHTQIIKGMLTWARLRKLCDVNPLDGLKIGTPEYDDPVFITNEQYEQLRAHTFTNKSLQQTADVFAILCRCGFHYGDLEDFVKQHKTALRTGVDGQPWIIKDRIKTEVKIRVPVFEEVDQVVRKYGGWEKLPLRPLVKFNFYLKLVAAELGLPETLSSKAGRKTFTDWCYNTLMLTTDSVIVLLGRTSASGLKVYGRPDERRVAAELANSQALKK